jgi:hypothetical protein
LSFSW